VSSNREQMNAGACGQSSSLYKFYAQTSINCPLLRGEYALLGFFCTQEAISQGIL